MSGPDDIVHSKPIECGIDLTGNFARACSGTAPVRQNVAYGSRLEVRDPIKAFNTAEAQAASQTILENVSDAERFMKVYAESLSEAAERSGNSELARDIDKMMQEYESGRRPSSTHRDFGDVVKYGEESYQRLDRMRERLSRFEDEVFKGSPESRSLISDSNYALDLSMAELGRSTQHLEKMITIEANLESEDPARYAAAPPPTRTI